MKKYLVGASLGIASLIVGASAYYYHHQDEFIFKNRTLSKDHVFTHKESFKELFLPVADRGEIHALHYTRENPKGIILYFHGQGRNLSYWGKDAELFLNHGYEVFVIDYRGFGKSTGHANGFKEEYVLEDAETAYNYLRTLYPEQEIIVYGQSLGTAFATWVASKHKPKTLILEAPYYNMHEAALFTKPFLPRWLLKIILKHPLKTNEWIRSVTAPIYIFHGTDDVILPYGHSQMLYSELKDSKKIEFITLEKWGHDRIHQNDTYLVNLEKILTRN